MTNPTNAEILRVLDFLRANHAGEPVDAPEAAPYRPDGFSRETNGFGARSHIEVDAVFNEFANDEIGKAILEREFRYLAFSQERHPELAPEDEHHQEIVRAARTRLNLMFSHISSGHDGAVQFVFLDSDIDRLFDGVHPDTSGTGYVFSPLNDLNPAKWARDYARNIRTLIAETKADAEAGIIRPGASPRGRRGAGHL